MNIIFLHPLALISNNSGSRLRPRKMLDTFDERGYQVLQIIGDRSERVNKFDELKRRLEAGEKFDYLYVESLSRPTNTRISQFAGVKFFQKENLDYNIMKLCIAHQIPVGFFLRDLYWDFPSYGTESALKQMYFNLIIPYFGRKEMKFLQQKGITVFSPSPAFADYIAENWHVKSTPLRPGTVIANSQERTISSDRIKLFYVGGVIGHYDMTVFLDGLIQFPEADLTMCVRKTERHVLGKYESSEHIKIVHGVGSELKPHYDKAEVAIYPLRPEGYIKLAFGVKLIEYIGQGLPIIAFEGSQTADFIRENNIGWIIKYDSDAVGKLLTWIQNNHEDYLEKQKCVLNIQSSFTWNSVVSLLEEKLRVNESAFTG